jgi:hypothetical protein
MKVNGYRISYHCLERIAQRWPEEAKKHRVLFDFVFWEINQAFEASRVSHRRPKWAPSIMGNEDKDRQVRFVWDEGENRCYVLRIQRRTSEEEQQYRRCYVVVTCLSRPDFDLMEQREQKIQSLVDYNQKLRRLDKGRLPNRGR